MISDLAEEKALDGFKFGRRKKALPISNLVEKRRKKKRKKRP